MEEHILAEGQLTGKYKRQLVVPTERTITNLSERREKCSLLKGIVMVDKDFTMDLAKLLIGAALSNCV